MRLRFKKVYGLQTPMGIVLERWGSEGVYEKSCDDLHYHYPTIVALHHCIFLMRFVVVYLVFFILNVIIDYLLSYWIIVIEPCLWYCVLSIHFTTLHHIVPSLGWFGGWDIMRRGVWLWLYQWDYCVASIGNMIYLSYTLSLFYPRVLVQRDWLSLIYCISESPSQMTLFTCWSWKD